MFFNRRIQDIAVKKARPWDLTSWVKQCQLPLYEAISFWGQPCNDVDSLWGALNGTYNAANSRPVDLSILDTIPSLPVQEWKPFSMLELTQALHACSSTSAPGPDHVTWGMLKTLAANLRIASLFLGLAEACIQLGHWPAHFKESLSVIILKLGKPSYLTPKLFRPIVLLNTLRKLVEKMLSCHMQYDGVSMVPSSLTSLEASPSVPWRMPVCSSPISSGLDGLRNLTLCSPHGRKIIQHFIHLNNVK